MKKQIITNVKVDKTFEGEDCLLMRTIVGSNKQNDKENFIILTERCNYYDEEVIVLDAEGNVVLDEDENPLTELIPKLKSLGKKDTESVFAVTDVKADLLYNAIKSNVTLGDSYSDFRNKIEHLGLLIGTQQDKPYGTLPTDWELLN